MHIERRTANDRTHQSLNISNKPFAVTKVFRLVNGKRGGEVRVEGALH